MWNLIRELSFFTGRGASVCDGWSPIEKFWSPLYICPKILVPPFALRKNSGPLPQHLIDIKNEASSKKILTPLFDPQKILAPPFGALKKNWSPHL